MSFYDKIKTQVTELRADLNYKDEGTAFGHFVIAECFRKIFDFGFLGTDEEMDAFIQAHVVDMSCDLGNDVIFTNQETGEVFFFQCKFSPHNLLSTEEVKKNKNFLDWLLGISSSPLKPNSKLRDVIEKEVKPVVDSKQGELVFIYVNAAFPPETRTDLMALFSNFRDQGIPFEVRFYDYPMLDDLYEDQAIPANKVSLRIVPNESFEKRLMFHDATDPVEDTPVRTLITSIRANSLKQVVEEHQESLFALNVRYFKGEKGPINQRIKEEYSKGSRSNFWLLNNGINAICKSYSVNDGALEARDFQIVNGGQTAKTLTKIVNDLPDEVHILMRLTEVNAAAKTSVIAKQIATASNNQNAISERDLHSGDRLQEELYRRFSTIGVFYDKKDGEWATVSDKRRFRDPAKKRAYRKVSNTEAAVDYLSFFLQTPASSRGRDKMVFSDLYYDQIFDSTTDPEVQCAKIVFAYRMSQKMGHLRVQLEQTHEILQNRYIHSYLVGLSALYFLRAELPNIRNPQDIVERLERVGWREKVDPENLRVELGGDFDNFARKVVEAMQFRLEVKKGVRAESSQQWLPKDTDNWLKLDASYREIITSTISRIRVA